MLQKNAKSGSILIVRRGLVMLKHYLLAFFVGWAFNYALDVTVVTRSSLQWLQHSWLAPFYDSSPSTAKRS